MSRGQMGPGQPGNDERQRAGLAGRDTYLCRSWPPPVNLALLLATWFGLLGYLGWRLVRQVRRHPPTEWRGTAS
jgi:hypothetical protein